MKVKYRRAKNLLYFRGFGIIWLKNVAVKANKQGAERLRSMLINFKLKTQIFSKCILTITLMIYLLNTTGITWSSRITMWESLNLIVKSS